MPSHDPGSTPRARVAEILGAVLAPGRDSASLAERLCAECVRSLDISGAGLILMNDHDNLGVLAVTDGPAALMEEMQFATGEGPCVDASRSGRPVLEPRMRDHAVARWPGYGSALAESPIEAAFAFPLQVGAIRIGVLDLYRMTPGPLTDEQFVGALAFADAAILILLHLRGNADGDPLDPMFDPLLRNAAIHQASGMIAVQLSTSLAEALLMLRAHAYAADVSMTAVATDVVNRKLRFDDSVAGTSTAEGA